MAQRASLPSITSEFQELLGDPQLLIKLTETEFFSDYANKSKLGNLVLLYEQNSTTKRCVDQWYKKVSELSDEKAKQRWMQALASFEYLPAKGFIIFQKLCSKDPHDRVVGRMMLNNWGRPSPPRVLKLEVESRTSSDSTTSSSSSSSNRSSGSSESELKSIPSLPSRLTTALVRGVLATDVEVDIFHTNKKPEEEFSAIDLIPNMDVIDKALGNSKDYLNEPFDTHDLEPNKITRWADFEGQSIDQHPDMSQISNWAEHDKNIAYRLAKCKKLKGEERLEWLKKAVRHGHWHAYFDLGCYLYANFQRTHNPECLAQSAFLFLLLDEFFSIATRPVSPHLRQFAHLEEFKAYPIPPGVDLDHLPPVYLDFQQKILAFLDGKSDLKNKKIEFSDLKRINYAAYKQAYSTYFYPLVNSTPPPSPHPEEEQSDPGSPSAVINYDLLNQYTNGWFSDRHQGRATAVLAALRHQPSQVVREIVQIQIDLFEGKKVGKVSAAAQKAFTDETTGCFGKTEGWERWLLRLEGRRNARQSKFYLAMKNILAQMNEDYQPDLDFSSAAAPLLPKRSR